jgi:hypothetical protein
MQGLPAHGEYGDSDPQNAGGIEKEILCSAISAIEGQGNADSEQQPDKPVPHRSAVRAGCVIVGAH